MAADHRLTDTAGNKLSFSCENASYKTDIDKGFQHGKSATKGSVFPSPLISNGYSLWLEHVKEIDTQADVYWLMWYDDRGKPVIPMSGIFNKQQLSEMAKQLASFVP